MIAITSASKRAAANVLPWMVPAGLSVAVAVTTTLLSLAPSAEPSPAVVVEPAPRHLPNPVWQPDASEVDWTLIEPAPEASALSVAAYTRGP